MLLWQTFMTICIVVIAVDSDSLTSDNNIHMMLFFCYFLELSLLSAFRRVRGRSPDSLKTVTHINSHWMGPA